MPRDISCKRGNIVKSRNTQFEARRKSANSFFFRPPPPLFFPVERQGGRKKKKKGARPWHYEAFTRAFTSDRLEIIRPVTSHNTKIMRVFTPTLSLSSFFLFLLFTAVKEGLRKLPEFLSSLPSPLPTRQWKLHRRDDPGRFSLSFSFPFFFRPPRTFSLILEPRALRGLEIGLGNWPRLIKRVLRARRGEREGRRFYCA